MSAKNIHSIGFANQAPIDTGHEEAVTQTHNKAQALNVQGERYALTRVVMTYLRSGAKITPWC